MNQHTTVMGINLPGVFARYGAYITFGILLLINVIITPNFVSINVVWNIVRQSATVLLIAEGMTIVISGGGINLSVGSTMALTCCITAAILSGSDTSVTLAVVLSIVASCAIGLIQGVIISVFDIQPMIVTIAFSYIIRGAAMLFKNGGLLSVSNYEFLDFGYYRVFRTIPVQAFIILLTLLIVFIIMRKMKFGRYVEAIGDNRSAARYAGLNTRGVIMLSYVVCSLLAGLAGVLEAARAGGSDAMTVGNTIEMDCVASAVIGGTLLTGGKANILGTMIGVFIMQTITIMINMNNITYEYSLLIKAAILLLGAASQQLNKQ